VIDAALTGGWAGTNGFRLMPEDPLAEAPAMITVTPGAGGHLAVVAYTWTHPDDGPQDGVLLAGPADEAGAVAVTWGDSWHQHPVPMTLTGRRAGTGFAVEAGYGGGWAWRIALDGDAAGLRLGMDNLGPDTDPYPVMVLRATRR
jgi:hypothetical protein